MIGFLVVPDTANTVVTISQNFYAKLMIFLYSETKWRMETYENIALGLITINDS